MTFVVYMLLNTNNQSSAWMPAIISSDKHHFMLTGFRFISKVTWAVWEIVVMNSGLPLSEDFVGSPIMKGS